MTTGRINQVTVVRALADAPPTRPIRGGPTAPTRRVNVGTPAEADRRLPSRGNQPSCRCRRRAQRPGEARRRTRRRQRSTKHRRRRAPPIFHSRSAFPLRDPNLQDCRAINALSPTTDSIGSGRGSAAQGGRRSERPMRGYAPGMPHDRRNGMDRRLPVSAEPRHNVVIGRKRRVC